jgi:hypothetical protein
MKKPITLTPQKLEANRLNAQKSTGPNTPDGKAASKFNAIKHGLLAQTVLVRGQQRRESLYKFKRLCREFYADLAPVGPLEEMLVDQIIQASWRLRRARTAESGEITLSVDEGHWQRHRPHPQQLWDLSEPWDDPVRNMENSAAGNHLLARWLCEVRARVEAEGELTDATIKIPFDGQPNGLAEELEKLRRACSPPPEAPAPDAAVQREETKRKLLARINIKLGHLDWQMQKCQQRELSEEQARQAAAVLPSADTLEKILRYETALERQLYRSMNELERLQRRRRGENVPAPLTVELSARP